MVEVFERYNSSWSSSGRKVPFYKYLASRSSLEEMNLLFLELRDVLYEQPCCSRHDGECPLMIFFEIDRPFPGGYRCNQELQQKLMALQQAYFLLTTGKTSN